MTFYFFIRHLLIMETFICKNKWNAVKVKHEIVIEPRRSLKRSRVLHDPHSITTTPHGIIWCGNFHITRFQINGLLLISQRILQRILIVPLLQATVSVQYLFQSRVLDLSFLLWITLDQDADNQ